MERDRAPIGFQHPKHKMRARSARGNAVAHLIMTVALILSIAVAAAAVSIGLARADGIQTMAGTHSGRLAAVVFFGLLCAGMGGLTATIARSRLH